MNIHLVIASAGDYSDKETWIVQAFTDETAAVEEAARLNAARQIISKLLKDYNEKRWHLQTVEAKKCEPSTDFNIDPWYQISFDDRTRIAQEITSQIGPKPEDPADDYTVVSIPIGEHGKWELP